MISLNHNNKFKIRIHNEEILNEDRFETRMCSKQFILLHNLTRCHKKIENGAEKDITYRKIKINMEINLEKTKTMIIVDKEKKHNIYIDEKILEKIHYSTT